MQGGSPGAGFFEHQYPGCTVGIGPAPPEAV
jgi:hypothetical protein